MNLLRSSLFMLWAVLVTVIVGPLIMCASLLGTRACYAMAWVFRRGIMFGAEHILCIRTEVRGRENMPAEAAGILAKHQSAWETVALQDLIPRGNHAVFVLKKELLSVPFLGWALASMRFISIDRSAGRNALEQVVEQGKDLSLIHI